MVRLSRPCGRPRTRPDRVLADKAYSSRAIRALPTPARDRRGDPRTRRPESPPQATRLGPRQTRQLRHDGLPRGRNVIERAFNDFKHWHGLATRYDKHAIVYRGGLVLAAALIWASDFGDTS